jgi:indole-3-glycerol phosphate synthase
VLGEDTKAMLDHAANMNLDALVEVHNEEELAIALDAGASIIGINNRDLTTFKIDTQCSFDLIDTIPSSIIKVAESGIHDPALARQYRAAGFDAVLIGEALVTSSNPAQFIKACRDVD